MRLDVASRRDRLGRLTRYYYDAVGRPSGTRDPLGRLVAQEWCACGSLEALDRRSWESDDLGTRPAGACDARDRERTA